MSDEWWNDFMAVAVFWFMCIEVGVAIGLVLAVFR